MFLLVCFVLFVSFSIRGYNSFLPARANSPPRYNIIVFIIALSFGFQISSAPPPILHSSTHSRHSQPPPTGATPIPAPMRQHKHSQHIRLRSCLKNASKEHSSKCKGNKISHNYQLLHKKILSFFSFCITESKPFETRHNSKHAFSENNFSLILDKPITKHYICGLIQLLALFVRIFATK